MKKKRENVHVLKGGHDNTQSKQTVGAGEKKRTKRIGGILLGLLLIALTTSFYVQLLPFLFIFIGGLMGVPVDAGLGDMDAIIWMLVSLGVLAPLVWLYITAIKYFWHRFVRGGE